MKTAAIWVFVFLSAFIVHATSYINPTVHFEDPVLQISFWLPSGFKEDPENRFLDSRHTYLKSYGGIPAQAIWFSVDSAGDRLPEESNHHLRGTVESKHGFPVRWGELCLQAERTLEWHEGFEEPIVSYLIRLPVEPEAITVQMMGTEGIESEMRALFRDFLAKIRGETDWDPEPSICDEEDQPK